MSFRDVFRIYSRDRQEAERVLAEAGDVREPEGIGEGAAAEGRERRSAGSRFPMALAKSRGSIRCPRSEMMVVPE